MEHDLDLDREHAAGAGLPEVEAALARGDGAAARAALGAEFERDPRNEELPLLLAMLDLREEDFAAAARRALAALAIRPFHPQALNLLGVACIEAGRPDDAVAVLETALRMAPGFSRARKNLKQARQLRKRLRRTGKAGESRAGAGCALPIEEIRTIPARSDGGLTVVIVPHEDPGVAGRSLESVRDVAGQVVWVEDVAARERPAFPEGLAVETIRPLRENDLGAAWTAGLRAAHGAWVLLLGPGERLEGVTGDLREALARSRALGQTVEVRTPGSAVGRLEVRLVRNAPGLCLRGRVAPDPGGPLRALAERWGLGTAAAPLVIERPGEPSPDTRAMLQRDLIDDPDDARARTLLARLQLREGAVAEALETVRQARATLDAAPREADAEELEDPVTLEAYVLARLGRHEESIALLEEHHRRFPATRATLYLHGLACLGLRRPKPAADLLRRALAAPATATRAEPVHEAFGPDVPNMLGAACLDLRDLPAAREAFGRALGLDAGNLEARLGLLGLDHAEGRLREVLEELDRLVRSHGDERRVWLAGDIVLGQVPDLAPAALEWMQEARRRLPDDPEIARRLGEAHLRCGEGRRALEVWGRAAPASPGPAATGAGVAAALACGAELPTVPLERRDALSEEVVGWFRAWATRGAIEALDRALTDIARAERTLPGIAERAAEWLTEIGQPEAASRARARAQSAGGV